MKKYFIYFILVYFIFTPSVYALDLTATGFIPGQIWYSKDSFVEGDSVDIHTAVWNNNSYPLSVRVQFYDGNVLLGYRDVSIPSLQLKDVSINWKVTSGDHSISAKIISPVIMSSSGEETAVLVHTLTGTDNKFIPILISTANGQPATSSDIIQSQIDKATSSLSSILPDSVSNPLTSNLGVVDNFRASTSKTINDIKNQTQSKIDALNKQDSANSVSKKVNGKVVVTPNKAGTTDATEKPIAYIKLFFLGVLSFVFGSKIIFYLLIVLVLFYIIRGIFRKIRNN